MARLSNRQWPGHVLLYALMMVNVACVCWRPRRPLAFAAFAGAVFVAFAMMTMAGEFGYLTQAGYTLQGRYFLPADPGTSRPRPLASRDPGPLRAAGWADCRQPPARHSRTVARYYVVDEWTGVRQGAAVPLTPPRRSVAPAPRPELPPPNRRHMGCDHIYCYATYELAPAPAPAPPEAGMIDWKQIVRARLEGLHSSRRLNRNSPKNWLSTSKTSITISSAAAAARRGIPDRPVGAR